MRITRLDMLFSNSMWVIIYRYNLKDSTLYSVLLIVIDAPDSSNQAQRFPISQIP